MATMYPVVHSLRTPEGVTLNTNRDILAHAKDHFEALFAHPMGPTCAPLYLEDIIPLVSAVEAEVLAADITIRYVLRTLSDVERVCKQGPMWGMPANKVRCPMLQRTNFPGERIEDLHSQDNSQVALQC